MSQNKKESALEKKKTKNSLKNKKNVEHNLYYCSDAGIHMNILLQICFYILKLKVNSIKYYKEDIASAPSSRLCLLCIDLIYILYENYIYHLCRKRNFFNSFYEYCLKLCALEETEKEEAEAEAETKNKMQMDSKNKETEKENEQSYDVNYLEFQELKKLSTRIKKALKNIFIELNYLYENITKLRNDFNEAQIMLVRSSNNTVLKYSIFLNLMNVAQLDNALSFLVKDLEKYKTVEAFLNWCDKDILEDEDEDEEEEEEDENENENELDKHKDKKDIHLNKELKRKKKIEKYLNINEEINKYINVSGYIFRDDNTLFNFVTDLFKHIEKINNENINFVNSFLSIDIAIFFPINSYTYITDMCKIYNRDELSKNEKILEMQYIHMTLVIGHFILNTNNVHIYNSCLGVLLLIHLNVKNKGLSSIALNFHNKLKKFDIDIFYEVLLCGLVGLYTAYINNALEEKDLLLFSTSIASRLGVKILERQKLPLCKFIHASINCSLNLKNYNTFLKYIFPFAQKLNLTEHQFNYMKKQIVLLLEAYNNLNAEKLTYKNSIFEHIMQIVKNEKKLSDEFKETTYENTYMNVNEDICMSLKKNVVSATNNESDGLKLKKSYTAREAERQEAKKTTTDKEKNRKVIHEKDQYGRKNSSEVTSSSYDDSEIEKLRDIKYIVKKEKNFEKNSEEEEEEEEDSFYIMKKKKTDISEISESELNTEEKEKYTKENRRKNEWAKNTNSYANLSTYTTDDKNNSASSLELYKSNKNKEGRPSGSFFKSTNELMSSPKPIRKKKANLHVVSSNRKSDLSNDSDYSSDLFAPLSMSQKDESSIDESSFNASVNKKIEKDDSVSPSVLGSLSSFKNNQHDKAFSYKHTSESTESNEREKQSPWIYENQEQSSIKGKENKKKKKYSSLSYADDLMDF